MDSGATADAEPKEVAVSWLDHGTLGFIDFQFKLLRQIPGDRPLYAEGCASTAYVDVAVIGVASEPKFTAFQFLVQLVEKQVGQQWG